MDKPDCPQNQRGKGTDKGLNGCPRSRLSTLRRTEVVAGAGACLQLGAVQYLHVNLAIALLLDPRRLHVAGYRRQPKCSWRRGQWCRGLLLWAVPLGSGRREANRIDGNIVELQLT